MIIEMSVCFVVFMCCEVTVFFQYIWFLTFLAGWVTLKAGCQSVKATLDFFLFFFINSTTEGVSTILIQFCFSKVKSLGPPL